ncbi:MAG TPA: hypothetical protein V6D14_20430 [Coleofasciculaceae cyanobacterium]|jgi:hypothetical protein
MALGSGEQDLLSNKFGSISNKRVIFFSNTGLFSDVAKEEIPINEIVSVRFYKQKTFVPWIAGGLGLLLSLVIYVLISGILIVKIISLVVLALASWIAFIGLSGMPTVAITTAGGKVIQSSGWPNNRNEAKAFALVLREQIK